MLRPQAETALSSLTIEPAGSGELHDLFASGVLRATESDWFRTPANELTSSTPGIAYFKANGETDYQLTANLMRARQGAGILLLDSGGDGFGLWLQPWLRGLSWRPIVDGGLKPPVVSVPYRSFVKTSASQVQDLLRLLFGSYPAFIAIVGFTGLATGVAVWAARFLGARDIPRDGPCNRPDKTKWFAIGFVVLALVANAYVAYFLLERLPHVQDSVAYLFQAKLFASGRLWAPLPDNVIFFRHEFVVEHAGKWFSKHPPGHSALLAIGQLLNAPWIVKSNRRLGVLGPDLSDRASSLRWLDGPVGRGFGCAFAILSIQLGIHDGPPDHADVPSRRHLVLAQGIGGRPPRAYARLWGLLWRRFPDPALDRDRDCCGFGNRIHPEGPAFGSQENRCPCSRRGNWFYTVRPNLLGIQLGPHRPSPPNHSTALVGFR